jgi:hypothetical protein
VLAPSVMYFKQTCTEIRPPLWSSGQEFLDTHPGARVRFPAGRKTSSGSGTGSAQPREYNWEATWQKSSGSYLENREYGRRDPSRGTIYPQKFAITSRTSGGRSVGIVRSRTQTMEFVLFYIDINHVAELEILKHANCNLSPSDR